MSRVVGAEVGVLHRVADASRVQPWWFNSRDGREDEAGRFDLSGDYGTCYWAETPMTALLERFTDPDDLDSLVPSSVVEGTRVWEHESPPPTEAADTTDAASGLPKELGAGADYGRCWPWADALHLAGHEAVRFWSRMDPEANRSVAVFGPKSTPAQPPDPALWPHGGCTPSDEWLDMLIDRGVVASTPTLGALDRAAPPGQ